MRQIRFGNAGEVAAALRLALKQGGTGAVPRVVREGKARAVPMCMHGITMRRCDDCGAFIATHPGTVRHVCGDNARSCADSRAA